MSHPSRMKMVVVSAFKRSLAQFITFCRLAEHAGWTARRWEQQTVEAWRPKRSPLCSKSGGVDGGARKTDKGQLLTEPL